MPLLYLDWNSALFIILNGTKEEHLDMLDGGIIQRLLEEKWKTFARVSVALCYKLMKIQNSTLCNCSSVYFSVHIQFQFKQYHEVCGHLK